METLPYGDHPEQTGDLHLPAAGDPRGAVVLWHGGSYETQYGRDMLDPLARALAGEGYTAYNATYRRLGSDGGFPETFDDALAAVGALTARLALDTPPAGIGCSPRAPLALHAAARGRLSRVVDVAGVSLPTVAARAGGPESSLQRLFGASPDEAPDAYAAVESAGAIDVPVLVLHGEADELVPVAMSRAYAERLGAGRAELVTYPGLGHFDLHAPPTEATDAILAFLAHPAPAAG